MRNDIQIRVMRKEDVSELLALYKRFDEIELLPWETQDVLARAIDLNAGLSQVATLSGSSIIGAVFAGHNGLRGSFHHLVVVPGYRRERVATQLVTTALQRFKSGNEFPRRIFVHVAAANAPAVNFWAKCGFRVTSGNEDFRSQIVCMVLDV